MNPDLHIWIIDDDNSIRWVLEKAMQQADITTSSFENADSAVEQLKNIQPDAIITDVRMPGMDGLELLDLLGTQYPQIPVIIMTAHSDLDSAVSAYKGGAFEYLPKPFDIDHAVELARRACAKGHETTQVNGESIDTPEIIGEAPAMQEVFRAIGRLSQSNINVLITGESGTGKELVASSLHRHSPRTDNPFIAINTAAIPRDLLESELFGHERGAFTGAQAQRKGRFEQADSGTLFLDEIGDMPADLQTRLLRVLADGVFYRVGGHTPIKVNVRVIAATHQDLQVNVKNGTFREDLYHRLNVFRVHIPPLRERREDIPLLLHHFLHNASRQQNASQKTLLPEVEEQLCQLDWPGNVRQLENACQWITVMASSHEVHLADLPPELLSQNEAMVGETTGEWQDMLRVWATNELNSGTPDLLSLATPILERVLIETALKKTGGRKNDAAKLLGWGRNTLTRKIKELGLE